MLILLGIALAVASLLASLRYGSRGALPLIGLLCLVTVMLLGAMLGLVPIMGLLAVLQIERQQTYGRVMAMACTPPAGLCLWQLIQARDGAQRQEQAAAILEQFQALGMAVEDGSQTLRAIIDAGLRMQPAIEMATLLLVFIVAYRLSEGLALRLGLSLPAPLPLTLWRPWEELIWVLIAALGLSLLSDGLLADLGLNLIVFMGIIYAVQGLAVLRFFAQRQRVPPLVELLFYVGLFFVAGLAFLPLAGLGLLDTWFDWRRLRPAPTEEEA
jgi:hypothetical protein